MKKLLLFIFSLTVLLSWGIVGIEAQSGPRANDSVQNALIFGDINNIPPVNLTSPPEWKIGMEKSFNVLNINSGIMDICQARIFLITENAVFWCDVNYQPTIPQTVIETLEAFDTEILPLLHDIFGHEVSPGIDNDPRFHVLFTDMIGDGYNGYFSAADSADPRLSPTSNGMELLFLNTHLIELGGDAVTDTLAHEFQHMIHFAYDRNEMSFINEGFSGLSEYIALGRLQDIFVRNYLYDTGRSLIWWPESGNNGPYYGSAYLFSVYLYDRFGADLIREIVKSPKSGLDGLDDALSTCEIPYSADDIFQQWTAALLGQLLQKPTREWNYPSYALPREGIYRDIGILPCGSTEMHEVSQYGLRLYSSTCSGLYRISITGNEASPVTSLTIPGGESAWWSGTVSNSMALLGHSFDLSHASGPVLFEYDANFSIEEGYDYYYLLLKDTKGNITRLSPSTASDNNPAGQNLGRGTTGRSNGVIHESIDLSQWTGQQITLTFVYLTDTATVGDGLLLDNFRIDAIGFIDDAETSDNGWESEGFYRIQAAVPQQFSLVVLYDEAYSYPRAEFFTFSGGESFSVVCPEGGCSFAVSALNSNIRSRASFTVVTEPIPHD